MEAPEIYPEVVYKYRNWENEWNKNTLLERQLYLASPGDLNDPFDCKIPTNFTKLSSSEIEQYAKGIIERFGGQLKEMGKNLEEELDFIIYRLTNEADQMQSDFEKGQFRDLDNHIGVLSLSTNWDNILMWSHYADFHRGYCIGFSELDLRNSGLFGSGGLVNYPEDLNYPYISPLDDKTRKAQFKNTHTKAFDWKYENEYRLTKFKFPEKLTNEERVVEIPKKAIKEVILGLKISLDNQNEIVQHCIENEVPVFKLKQVRFKFQVEKEAINDLV